MHDSSASLYSWKSKLSCTRDTHPMTLARQAALYARYLCSRDAFGQARARYDRVSCIQQAAVRSPPNSQETRARQPTHTCIQYTLSSRAAFSLRLSAPREQRYLAYKGILHTKVSCIQYAHTTDSLMTRDDNVTLATSSSMMHEADRLSMPRNNLNEWRSKQH